MRESDEAEADRFLIRKEVSFGGIARLNRTAEAYHLGVPFSRVDEIRDALLAEGELVAVKVEGWKPVHYVLSRDLPLLAELGAGRVPAAWAPLATSTEEEVVFLSPLDPVSARGRAKILFGFDYIWEVYKPAPQRKYGYYVLPVLWGDRLVARFDSKFDRTTNAFVVLSFWLEDERLSQDEAFAEALAGGFIRFGKFLGASGLNVAAINEPLLRQRIELVGSGLQASVKSQ